jgi:hypothetical protein
MDYVKSGFAPLTVPVSLRDASQSFREGGCAVQVRAGGARRVLLVFSAIPAGVYPISGFRDEGDVFL